jgi:hypothetical protein
MAWMLAQLGRKPRFGPVLLLLVLLFEAVTFGFGAPIVPGPVGTPGAWAVRLANLMAALAMFWFLLIRHPGSLARPRAGWDE